MAARTERARHKITVKEYADGTPFLAFELLEGDGLASFPDVHFGLDLRAGTTYEQAQELARQINQGVQGLSATIFASG